MQDLLKNSKKTKINLHDYDYKKDIQRRLILRSLSLKEMSVLEEILYSPLQFSPESLQDNLDIPLADIYKIIEKLFPLDLFTLNGKKIHVDKEKRKYFETQIERFSEDFSPNLDCFQNLLKAIPIEVLPNWYHISRTSSNIFQSIVEKYLLTPQIYNRYLIDFFSTHDFFKAIYDEMLQQKTLTIPITTLLKKFSITREAFEETILSLEYNLLAFLSHEKKDDVFEEILSPFQEWKDYLLALKRVTPPSISSVTPFRPQEYAFIEDMSSLLQLLKKKEITVVFDAIKDLWCLQAKHQKIVQDLLDIEDDSYHYITRIINKLITLGLIVIEETRVLPTKASIEWLDIPVPQRAHVTFKHPHNYFLMQKDSPLFNQRSLIEIQKALASLIDLEWVSIDDFLTTAIIPLSEDRSITLKKVGKTWGYQLPLLNNEEKAFVRSIILNWFFESGLVQIGTAKGNITSFKLTGLGKSLVL